MLSTDIFYKQVYYANNIIFTNMFIERVVALTQNINLKELEKNAWKSLFEDGLLDIVFGVLLITFAITPIIRQQIGLWYIPIVIVPAPLIIIIGKKYLTVPRIGIVKFGPKRRSAHKKLVMIFSITTVVLITLVFWTIARIFPGVLGTFLKGYAVPLIIGISAIIGMSIVACLMDFQRLYIYGVLIGFGNIAAEVLHNTIGSPLDSLIPFGIPGVVVFAYGVKFFFRFLHDYPLPAEGSE